MALVPSSTNVTKHFAAAYGYVSETGKPGFGVGHVQRPPLKVILTAHWLVIEMCVFGDCVTFSAEIFGNGISYYIYYAKRENFINSDSLLQSNPHLYIRASFKRP